MIKINGKVAKIGNGYHLLIPKALIKCNVLKEGNKYNFIVTEETDNPENSEVPFRTTDHLLPFENLGVAL